MKYLFVTKSSIVPFLAFITIFFSCSPKMAQVEKAAVKSTHAEPEASSLRVMSYNVHHCNPPSRPGVIDVDAIVNTISQQHPDIIALQEVDVNTTRSGKINQAAEIARKLNMQFFFGKAIDHEGGEYGVAILSKYLLTETTVHSLPTKDGSGGEPRVLAIAKILLPNNRIIRFGATHLDAQRDQQNRLLQISKINSIASMEDLPFLLAGDLNASPETEVIRHLDTQFKRTCEPCAFTFPEKNPRTTIDYIAYKPAQVFLVASHQVVEESYASDHRPVMAVLNLSSE